MPELDLPAPAEEKELPPPSAGAPADLNEVTSSSDWSWLGGLILAILLFYFFAPLSWKNWVKEQWQKLPVEISVKIKKASVVTVTPTPTAVPHLPSPTSPAADFTSSPEAMPAE